MPVRTRVEPIDRDVQVILREELSPQARSALLARFAREALQEAEALNRGVLGRVPPRTTFVDGREGASEDSVRPDGTIVYEFELLSDLMVWIGEQLLRHSPYRGGGYRRGHTLFADGAEVPIGAPAPAAREYIFINVVPYARKIERGASKQAPDGVYELVAGQAARRFGNIARVRFTYRTAIGPSLAGGRAGNRSQERNPAISVTVR